MRIVIGVDVSKEKLDFSIYDGNKHKLFCVTNDRSGIITMMKKFEDCTTEFIFVMEATGVYHLGLATMLYEHDFQVGVINPLIIKRYSQMRMSRAKTDKVDAKLIAEYGFEQQIRLFKPASKERQKIVKLLKAIEKLTVTKDSYHNRLEALSQDPFQIDLLNRSFKQLIRKIEKMIEKFEKELVEIVKEHYSETYKRLISITGVGNKTANAIIGFFGKFESFETSKQVASFIGVNPSPRESGSSVKGRGRISRKGNRYLRKQLFMASLSAMQYNKACRKLYERLVLKGKEHKVCRVAVVNKMIKQIFAIVKYERMYNENYQRKSLPI